MSRTGYTSRRQFVQQASFLSAALGLGPLAVGASFAKSEAEITPDEILARLLEGNARFAGGNTKLSPRTPDDFERDTEGQAPPAVILGCADSRVPPEFVFDQPVGQLFVLRVAGNIVGSGPILKGSIEYAAAELGARLIVVLGHSECGACKAAITHIENNDALPGSIEGMVDYIRPVVRQTAGQPGDKFVNVIKANAVANARRLETLGPILPGLVKQGKLKMVGAFYDMQTGKVEVLS
jgi:carbonic anhydrase